MRFMTLERPRPVEELPLAMAQGPDAAPGAGEIAVAVEACGVCRTDLHIVEGEVSAPLPVVPGHQVAGRVAAVGAGVTAFAPGDCVGVGWVSTTCERCVFCRTGRENLCESATFTGRDRPGGYADWMTAPAEAAVPLPAGLAPSAAAPLLCAGIIGYRSLKLSEARPGGRLGLFGFGASAHLAIQVARFWGCEVYVFTREPRPRELARELGAAWAGAIDEDPGASLDAAVIFAPAGEVVPAALARLGRGGTLSINAIHMSAIPSMDYERLYGERTLRSVMNFTRRDAAEFLELAARIPVTASVELFPLEQANEALLRVKNGTVRGAAVLRMESSR